MKLFIVKSEKYLSILLEISQKGIIFAPANWHLPCRDEATVTATWGASLVLQDCEAEIRPIEPGQVILAREHAEPHLVLLFILIFLRKMKKVLFMELKYLKEVEEI